MTEKTTIQIATSGKEADELLAELDKYFAGAYSVEFLAEGQYVIENNLNLFSLDCLLSDLIKIAINYGPDTYYKIIYVKSKSVHFRCKDMGV